MRNLNNRIQRLEAIVRPTPEVKFDISSCFNIRVAGVPRCVSQARMLLRLGKMAFNKKCSKPEQLKCLLHIYRIAPALRSARVCNWQANAGTNLDKWKSLIDEAVRVAEKIEMHFSEPPHGGKNSS